MKKYKSDDKKQEQSILEEPAVAYGTVNYFALANNMITKDYIKSTLTRIM